MDLILCHTTADFDTLGAAVGLTCLYPGARIVLSGGAHPSVRDFLALHRDEYPLIERRSVNPDHIRSIFLVDAQQRDRFGKAAEWLDLPGVTLRVFDHHLGSRSDIPTAEKQIEAIGAATTLIVEQLQAQQVAPNPVQATVMALGIHVDTGSLTYDHTTARDARALAWLMEQGASLRTIAEYVDPGLSPALQEQLTEAMERLETERVQGTTIGWVLLKLDNFTPGLSSVASRLMELTDLDALLLAAEYCRGSGCSLEDGDGDMLSLIGRSRIDGVDLNALLQPFNGGGHPRAAAANLHNAPSQETLLQIVRQLKTQIPQPPTARELMSSPVRTIRPETTIDEAQRILLRYGHSGLSVVDATGQLVGVISRRDLDIALHHGFSHAPVKGYMTTTLRTIAPDTPLPDIEALMVTYDVGRLPVLEAGNLIGIVTRTDVLRQRHREAFADREAIVAGTVSPHPLPEARHPSLLLQALRQCLLPELWQLLNQAAEQAEQRGWQLYVVGGAVRDLLLNLLTAGSSSPNGSASHCNRSLLIQDLDLVVDGFHQSADSGAGVELARSLQTLHPQARLEVHGKFQTAALLWHNDPVLKSLWIDIATARTEFYPYPAANPEVEASSIRQDLYRRDFTINAMAIRLTRPSAGELLDFFGGVWDLQAMQVRVLHANSFIEDPTRIFRAVRFAVRLGFTIDPQTEGYIRHAIASGIYNQVQSQQASAPALQTRLRAELKYILQAPYWKAALHTLADLDALRCIHPALTMNRSLWQQLRLVARGLSRLSAHPAESPLPPVPVWLLVLEVILAQLDPDDRVAVAENLQLPTDSVDRLKHLATAEVEIGQTVASGRSISQTTQQFQRYAAPLLWLVAIRGDRRVRRTILRYLCEWASVKPPIDGKDLKAMGYQPGPQFRQILEALTAATLDGDIRDRPDAENFLREHFPLS